MTADQINGMFEFVGSLALWMNVWTVHKAKQVRGVMWQVSGFFLAWGIWNLYYYPSLGQWISFTGGISICLANCVWVSLAIYYARAEK